MKCKHCNGTGKVRGYFYEKTGVNKWEKVWGDSPCDECGGTGKIQQTNEEWRKNCSAEVFAYWLADVCAWAMEEFRCGNTEKANIVYWEKWLKQHREENEK